MIERRSTEIIFHSVLLVKESIDLVNIDLGLRLPQEFALLSLHVAAQSIGVSARPKDEAI